MKRNWSLRLTAILGGGAITLLALVLVAYQYGNRPSMSNMELAAGLGAAIAGVLTLI
jgi:4-amino-4-deoxy-L-arabinose transferase-like glycosyltransferase